MISSQSPYYYRGTFIHEANFDEVDVTSAIVRSRSAPAGKSYETVGANDEERRNYTVKLAEKVDEFVRLHNESVTGSNGSDFEERQHNESVAGSSSSDFEEQPVITTFMVRNIPCSISKQQLKASLESLGLAGTYDFLHLPGARKRSNLGYFFINFTKEVAAEKAAIFEGYRFPNTNSSKVCTVAPAKFQGLNANIRQLGCDVRVKGMPKEVYNTPKLNDADAIVRKDPTLDSVAVTVLHTGDIVEQAAPLLASSDGIIQMHITSNITRKEDTETGDGAHGRNARHVKNLGWVTIDATAAGGPVLLKPLVDMDKDKRRRRPRRQWA